MKAAKSYIPLSLLSIFFYIALSSLKYSSEHPKVEWDTSPENVVISYDFFGELDYGYIPDFRIWGDGYMVWVKHDSNGARKVYEGYLSQAELKGLIEQFVGAGFYSLFGNDYSSSINISITLLTKQKQNSINANKKISELTDYLRSGAGLEAKEFHPTIGYLYAFPIEETAYFNYKVIPYQWLQGKFDEDFKNFDKLYPNGKEITGDELAYIWNIVNASPFIESNGRTFWIAVEIPKITY